MGRSSSDVFEDIIWNARFAKEDSETGRHENALSIIEGLGKFLLEAKSKLEYEIECKREALYGPR